MKHISDDKQFYGLVAVGERGQIVIPKEARRDFNLKQSDKLIVMGRSGGPLILMKAEVMKDFAEKILQSISLKG